MSHKTFNLLPIAAATVLVCSASYAQTSADAQALTSPDSTSISVGVGAVNNTRDALRFGQYTGLNKDASALVDFEMIKRDEATGTGMRFTGRNLGLDTRELNYTRQKQGDWGFALDYNEIVRNDPYVINTGMTGIGTTTPTINLIARPAMPAAWATDNGYTASNGVLGHDEQLQVKRTALGLSGEKWISPNLQLELSFRNENKTGARLFGRVGIGSSDMQATTATSGLGAYALLLTPEPIDSAIRSLEAKLNFNQGALALSAGYYGSFFTNNNGSLNPVLAGASLNRGALLAGAGCSLVAPWTSCSVQQQAQSSVALPPDNQAHQFYASGTYALTQATRTNFKLSYTHATQDESFAGMGLTSSGPTSLGGVVDTTLAQIGLTSKASKALTINASLRYEDRADKTQVAVYNFGKLGGALDATTNWASGSQTRTSAKVDGIYRLGNGYSTTVGLNWDRNTTPLPPANTAIFAAQVLFRETLSETGLHATVRKAMSESLNGALSLELKQRRGDDNGWFTTTGTAGNAVVAFDPASAATGNRVLPDMYMDRDRSRVRANVDWDANDKLSLQAVLEHGQDDYKRAWNVAPQLIPTIAGARTVSTDSLTLDSSYQLASDWRLGAYWTHSENRWNVNKVNLGDDTKNASDTLGITVKGKVNPKLSVGVDLTATQDKTTFNNVVATSASGNIVGWAGQTLPGNYLPDINYTTTKLNLFAVYEVDKKSALKFNVAYQKFSTDDWQWGYNGVPFVYSDNTTVSNPDQSLTFLGVTYIYKF